MSIEDPRLSSIDNTSAADEFDSAVKQHLGFGSETVDGIEVAQAETPDAGRTDRLPAQAPVETAAAIIPSEVSPDAGNVVTLPAGIELDNLEFAVEGDNLVLVLADGTEIIVLGGAANIPTFVIGDVELPQVALFAALEGSNINVAAGPDGTFSAQGGPTASRNFNDDPIDAGPEDLALADLLGDTAFGDDQLNGTIFGGAGAPSIPLEIALTESFIFDEAVIADGDTGNQTITGTLPFNPGPDFGTISSINFTGASNVDEGDGSTVLAGFTSGGRPITVTSNPAPADGAIKVFEAITAVDSEGNPVFTLTVNRETGEFTFELVGKLEHPDAGANGAQDDLDDLLRLGFTYTVTDLDGDSVTGTFNIDVMDDAPTIGAPEGDSVNEDDLTGKFDGPDYNYVKVISDSPSEDEPKMPSPYKNPTAEGSLAIRWGADDDLKSETLGEGNEPTGDDPVGRTVGFTGLDTNSTSEEIEAAIPGLANLSSDGSPLSYRIEYTRDDAGKWNGGYQLIAFKSYGDGPYYAEKSLFAEPSFDGPIYLGPGYERGAVFIITLDPTTANGSYTFELIGNLDHYAPDATVPDVIVSPEPDLPGDVQTAAFVKVEGPSIDGKPVDFLDLEIPFTATDSDGDSVDGSVTVRVEDDEPVVVGDAIALEVDEDDIQTGSSTGTSPNDGNGDGSYTGDSWSNGSGPATVSGYLGGLVDFGADNEETHFSIIDEAAARSELSKLGLTSKGGPLSFDVIGNTLYAFVNKDAPGVEYNAGQDRLVFSLTVENWGAYKFELHDQLDHDKPAFGRDQNTDLQDGIVGKDVTAIDFGSIIEATDFDGDSVSLTGKLSVTIVDDVPELVKGATEYRTVDEDDIRNSQSTGTSPNDSNGDGSFTGSPNNNQPGPGFISGSLSSLVKGGADDTIKFEFIDEAALRQTLSGLNLSSKGETLSFDLQGNVLWGFANVGGPSGVSYDPENQDRPVFKLTLNQNGSYTFELIDQLDHDAPVLGADPNFGLRGSNADAINFGSVIKVTDHDGDSITLGKAFSIEIRDDVPVLSGTKENRLVDEDDIDTDQSLGTSPKDGNADQSWTGGPGQNGKGGAFIDGSLAGLIKGGADDTVKFSFIAENDARDALEKLGLKSQGQELSYDIRDGVLYAFDNAGSQQGESYDNGDRLVFKLTIGENGSYSFELVDQLDHDDAKGQNTDLEDDVKGDVEAIDFGSIIKATDHDGDSVVLKDAFSITIKDDVPVLSGTKEDRIIDEDDIATIGTAVPGESLGTSPNDGDADDSFTQSSSNNQPGPAYISGSLANLVKGGADDPITFAFISESAIRSILSNLELSSKGAILSYDLKSDGTLYAFDNAGPYTGDTYDTGSDRLVFSLKLNGDGSYEFRLFDQLDHDRPFDDMGDGQGIADENYDLQDGSSKSDVTAINFGKLISATDYDGDSISLDGAFSIKVRDDIPEAIARNTSATLVVDESDKPQNDDIGYSLDAFKHVDSKGEDPTMSTQFARQSNFVTSTINGGADDGVKIDWDLKINGGNGTDSGLFTTDGRAILLFLEDGLIVGRYDKPNDGNTEVNSSDPAAFALQLSDDGTLSMVQYVSIKHDDPTDHDENNDANDNNLSTAVQSLAGKINAVLTVTDYDGDKAVSEVAVGDRVQFHDDGPSVSCEAIAFTVDEDGLRGATKDTGLAGEVAGSGSALYNGGVNALKALFDFGADGAHATQAISLKETAEPVKTDFKSQGGDVLIKVVGNVLTGYVAGTDGAEDRPVFVLTVNADSSYTFELKDQIDHSNPDGNTETYLEDGIDLSAYIVGKDGDGDTVTLTDGKFVVNVLDDIPAATGEPVNVKVDAPQIVEPVEGKVANFVLVLDTSGSVNVQQFQTQVKEFLDNLADTDAKDVRVHIVEFNSGAKPVGTYDLIVNGETNADALEKALDDIEDLNDGGNTNYEAGLREALEWIEGIQPSTINVDSVQYTDPNGSQEDNRALILSGNGEQLALVSGWWQNGTQLENANIDYNGRIGVSSTDFQTITNTEVLRFDFGQFTDFDGNGVFANQGNFDGADVTSASFRLSDLVHPGSTSFSYTVHFTDGSSAPIVLQVNGSENITVSAPAGKLIDYVEFTVASGEGQVQLRSVTTAPDGPLANADVNELIFLSDGEPNRNETEWWDTSAREALEQIKDEIAKIESGASGPAFTIQAWGIKPSGNNLNNLDKVEGQGGDAEDLADGTLSDKYAAIFAAIGGTTGSTQPAEANFDVSALISSGADEALAFSLKSGTPYLAPLASGGVALVYSVLDNVLTAKAGENGPTVFTMSLEKNGEGTFTLYAPIDGHGDKVIDFSSVIQAKDFDGDTVSVPADTFTVTFDGVPFGAPQTFGGDEDEVITGKIAAIIGSDGVGATGGFEITVDPAHGEITSFDPDTGEFTFKPNDDWNGTDSFTVTVKDDDGDVSQHFVVTLNVAAVNDEPVITSGSVGSINENAPASTVVYTATATDVDGPSTTYSLSGDDADKFNIDQNGRVTFKTSPNFESPTDTGGNNVYDIKVVASDGNESAVKDVAITVNNVNEAPTAINFQSPNASAGFSIELARSSAEIVNLANADALLAGTNQTAKQEANSSTVNFGPGGNFGGDSIFPSGGGDEFAVRATGTINITTSGTWTFGTHSDDGVRLKIDGQVVILDDAIHPGQNTFGQVYLTAGQHTIELVYFEHQGGELVELFAQAGAHSSWNDGFKLIGDVANGGLAVTDVLSIDENNLAGAVVATLTATDVDANDTHTFQLVSGTGDTDNAHFTIVGNELRLVGSADYETKSSYTIRVQATDAGGETYVTTKTILVNDLVENTPATIGGVSTGFVTEDAVGSSQITYSEDFEAQSSVNGWTNGFRGGGFNGGSNEYVSENNFVEFDGQQSISKTLTLASAASETVIDFDFFKIDSWDQGEKLLVYLNDQMAFAFTPENSGNDGLDGATGSFTIGGIVATYVITSSGFDSQLGGNGSGDRVYHVQITASGIGDQVKLGFGNNLDQSYTDEDFGIDNIVVHGNEPPALQAKGQLTINDPDAGEAAFVVQDNIDGTYGHFSIDADGTWTYVLDNGSSATQALAEGQTETDSFTVTSVDGTTHTVNVTVNGTNDAPVANNDIVLTNIVDGSPIYIPEAALLMNDQDVDNDHLKIISSGNAVNGTVSGTIAFDPTNPVTTILDANFNGNNANGFAYEDGRFGGQYPTDFATGSVSGSKLQVKVGDYSNERNNYSLEDRDGGWARSFTLAAATTVTIAFDYKLFISEGTDTGEFAQALFTIDGVKYGTGSNNYLAQLDGSNAGGALSADGRFEITLHLEAGTHELVLGAYINEFDTGSKNSDEYATAEFDNVLITGAAVIADGSFDYTVNDGIISDTGGVSIHAVAGSTITGTASDEILIAGDGDDILSGMGGDDYLSGGLGNDFLNGGEGNDILFGGLGFDTLAGGADADTFRFDETAFEDIHVTDVITDYSLTDGDMLDVTALLDSLLGENSSDFERLTAIETRNDGVNTFVSVTDEGVTKDIAMLNGVHDVKILFDDKHASTIVHD